MDYAGKDIMKLSVNFAYKYYIVGQYESVYDSDKADAGFSPYNFMGDSPSTYTPIFNETPGAVKTKNDPLNSFMNRLKNFAIGAVGSKIVTKLPSILKR
jgi:hypothetical protein